MAGKEKEGSSGGSSLLEWLILLSVGVGGGYLAYRYRDHLMDYINSLEKEKKELKSELSQFRKEEREKGLAF